MQLLEACDFFLAHCQSSVSLSPHTLRAYTGDLNGFSLFVGKNKLFGRVKMEDLRAYINHLRNEKFLADSSVRRKLASIKLLFKWGVRCGYIQNNPFFVLDERIKVPKKLPRALDMGDLRRLKNAIQISGNNNYDTMLEKTLILILIETGVRIGELSKVEIDDVSISDNCIKINGKGNRQRFVYFVSKDLQKTVLLLMKWRLKILSSSKKFFVFSNKKEVTPEKARKILHRFSQESGIRINVTPHMLRHTCATQWLEKGLDIRYVQRLLGHYSISTTEIYTYVSDKSLREALQRASRRMA